LASAIADEYETRVHRARVFVSGEVGKEEGSVFFFEKKKQKTFVTWAGGNRKGLV
jgi:hypothetical protein